MRRLTKLLAAASIIIAIFCVSFAFFYKRAQKNLSENLPAPTPLILTSAVINQPLPKANLVNSSGKVLADERLRRGKVVLIFTLTTCQLCDQENEFLKTLVGFRKDVSFFYVIPFGNKDEVLKTAQGKYPFETFFDQDSMLSQSLEVYQVPIVVFLQDGTIKKTWLEGAKVDSQGQAEFKNWLSSL
jgi:hypothetical protein